MKDELVCWLTGHDWWTSSLGDKCQRCGKVREVGERPDTETTDSVDKSNTWSPEDGAGYIPSTERPGDER